MRYLGKLVGLALGAMAGPLGAVMGVVIGHQYDQRVEPVIAGKARSFFELCFAVMGYLAKSDGRVSEQEIAAARQIMDELRLDATHQRWAIEAFTAGKNGEWSRAELVGSLQRIFKIQPELQWIFLELQLRAMLVGNGLHATVREQLWRVAYELQIRAEQFSELEREVRMALDPTVYADQSILQAYQTLQINPSASDEQLKKAYRRLMSENHPDKLVSQGLPEAMLELAKQKTQRIREAYEVLCDERQIR